MVHVSFIQLLLCLDTTSHNNKQLKWLSHDYEMPSLGFTAKDFDFLFLNLNWTTSCIQSMVWRTYILSLVGSLPRADAIPRGAGREFLKPALQGRHWPFLGSFCLFLCKFVLVIWVTAGVGVDSGTYITGSWLQWDSGKQGYWQSDRSAQ